MELNGAWLRNCYNLCGPDVGSQDTKLRVNIPYYQRPYKWGKEHIRRLIYDFFEHTGGYNNLSNNIIKYFAGAIVTVGNNKGGYHDIIDGQQRITTVFLMGYLRFLILRAFIDEVISRKRLSKATNYADSISNCYRSIIGEGRNLNCKSLHDYIVNKADEIERIVCSNSRENEADQFLKDYRKMTKLPLIDKSNMQNYYEKYTEGLDELLQNEELGLKYSRKSFNERLKKALKLIFVEVSDRGFNVELIIDDDYQQDIIVQQYTDSIIYIYEELLNIIRKNNTSYDSLNAIEKAILFINETEVFLKYLEFCLIRAGNANDAYTLFEVLNDRALEVDDLDLIKNLFYKKYCDHNEGRIDQAILDKQIEELEEIWGEKVFTQDLGVNRTKLVSFLAIVYLTGKCNIDFNVKQRYRDEVKKYLDNKTSFDYTNVKQDIMLFQLIKTMIVDIFSLPFQKNKSELEVLRAIKTGDFSITYQAMHLINALRFNGVLPALTSIILKKFLDASASSSSRQGIIDLNKFNEYCKNIINDKEHINNDFKDIHECAFNIWKLTLLGKNYQLARNYTIRNISKINHINTFYDSSSISLNQGELDEAIEEFKQWSQTWRYGSSSQDYFKIKLLFLILLKTNRFNDKLEYSQAPRVISEIEKLQLDHLEARNIDQTNSDLYFKPSATGRERSEFVDILGNFMLIHQARNAQKNNKPIFSAPTYYELMGLDGHWLIEEIKELLNHNSNQVQGYKKTVKVPHEGFFNERNKRIRSYFGSILINRDLNSQEIPIKDITTF